MREGEGVIFGGFLPQEKVSAEYAERDRLRSALNHQCGLCDPPFDLRLSELRSLSSSSRGRLEDSEEERLRLEKEHDSMFAASCEANHLMAR